MSYSPKAADVAKLRNATGVGMMDCKKALIEAEGDFDKAIELLRKKGQKIAASRADRENSEGAVIAAISPDHKKGVIISLKCETDFVAKNEDFVKLANQLAQAALTYTSKEDFLSSDFGGVKVQDKLIEEIGKIGEKIEIGDFKSIEAPYIASYIHNGNKIASLTAFSVEIEPEVGKNISMQIAAMNPIALDANSVDQNLIDKEMQIAKEQTLEEGKPENMIENIAKGKVNKFLKENTLLSQVYIKANDGKQNVQEYLKTVNPDVKIIAYERVGLI